MTARELLQELQGLDERDLDLPVWLQFKDTSGAVYTDVAADIEPTIWSTGEMTVTITGQNAIWKGGNPCAPPGRQLPPILDACCGGRMMWANKVDRDILAQDIRSEVVLMTDRGETRSLAVKPDIIGDFRKMQFPDNTFPLIMFDPPHLVRAGVNSWLRKKYGKLDKQNWQQDLADAFRECERVLAHKGTLVFKWNTCQLAKKDIEACFCMRPKFINRVGKTYIYIFYKK